MRAQFAGRPVAGGRIGDDLIAFPEDADPEIPGILKFVSRWDEIEVDWATSTLSNLTQGTTIGFEPLPHADFAMLQAGGLENYLKNRFFKHILSHRHVFAHHCFG